MWGPEPQDPIREAAVKTRYATVLIAFGLLVSAKTALPASGTDAEALIGRAAAVLLGPGGTREAMIGALDDILDASVLILPPSGDSEEFKWRIETAKKTMAERSPFNDKVRQYVGLAYRLVSGGPSWRMPEEMTSAYRNTDIMARAKKVGQNLVDSALAERKAGRNDRAVLCLLSLVLMVITPVQA
jgi:hypothetical protein